ncbi:hypothetical protein C0991_004291 [Blastosporella zonata]|nr:hypothetical protein C0991_004291 [Blastosporella zonata]
MSTTTTQAKNSSPAEFTIFARVTAIPLVASNLNRIDCILSENTLTRFSYRTAKELSSSAIKLAEPLQSRFSPIICTADGYANKAVDVVQSRYPYPFTAKPEDVASLIQERRQNAADLVTGYYNETGKKIDDNIRTPAINVATDLDKRFSPLVDYYEVAVRRTANDPQACPSTPPDAKYQYQRALFLSKTLKDNFFVYSNEQFQHLQAQHATLQRASEVAQSINDLATTSVASASTQVHNLSNTMIVELQKFQQHTASFSASFRSSVHDSAVQLQNHIPPQIHQTYTEVTNNFSAAALELKNIVAKENITIQEKVSLAAQEVQDRINPAIEKIKHLVSELLSRSKDNASHAAPSGAGDS